MSSTPHSPASPAVPPVETTIAGLRTRLDAGRGQGRTIALVPTMGALHDGHRALIEHAREVADTAIVSLFVNPLQFGPAEDFDRYPRDLDADRRACAGLGVDAIFAPAIDEMYPDGAVQTRVTAGPVGGIFEGAARPGHFDGMLTVVAKLLAIAQPDVVVLGEKDAQQVFLVQRMVRDLDIRTRVDVVDTVRAADGLALSSRNAYLDEAERQAARSIPAALDAARAAADRGVEAALAAARAVLDGEPGLTLDYLAAVRPDTFQPVEPAHRGPARALIAARVGATRLIDTALLQLG